MGRFIRLFAATLLTTLILASTALAQDSPQETTGGGDPFFVAPKSQSTAMEGHTIMEGTAAGVGEDLPGSGGPSILLPAAALLFGSGILGYAVAMRRR